MTSVLPHSRDDRATLPLHQRLHGLRIQHPVLEPGIERPYQMHSHLTFDTLSAPEFRIHREPDAVGSDDFCGPEPGDEDFRCAEIDQVVCKFHGCFPLSQVCAGEVNDSFAESFELSRCVLGAASWANRRRYLLPGQVKGGEQRFPAGHGRAHESLAMSRECYGRARRPRILPPAPTRANVRQNIGFPASAGRAPRRLPQSSMKCSTEVMRGAA